MKDIRLGSLKIPLADYAIQGNALLGIKESGKTYTAMMIAEQLLDNNLPFIAFDWIGVWKNIKRPGKGKGYPVVVAGGRDGDLPLSPASTSEIIRAAMSENIPLVVDLYSRELTKADRRRIMQTAVEILLDENEEHGMRHLFFEEAAEAAPQRIGNDQTKLYSAIESLARMGGNALLGYTLINQRAEEVNKAVLEICDCLILMRQRGKNSLLSLSKWLTAGAVEDEKIISSSLATLPTGEAWIWTRDNAQPVRVKMQEKNSFHPNRKDTARRPLKSKAAVDVSSFVERLGAAIPQIVEQTKQNDPAELRKQIAQLQRELAKKPSAEKVIERVEVPVVDKALLADIRTLERSVRNHVTELNVIVESAGRLLQKAESAPIKSGPSASIRQPVVTSKPVSPAVTSSSTNGDLSGPQQRILDAIAWFESIGIDQPKQPAVAFLAGYKYGGGAYNNPRGTLRSLGMVEYVVGNQIAMTDEGRKHANHPEKPLTVEELHQHVLSVLPGPQQKILSVLLKKYPTPISKEECAAEAGYAQGGAFNNPLGNMRTMGIVSYPQPGMVVAEPLLFLE